MICRSSRAFRYTISCKPIVKVSLSKISQREIRQLTGAPVAGLADSDRDEMAIPSYLHGNPLIPWLMWKRYEAIAELAQFSGNEHVLEFGCGIGLFLPTLAGACKTVSAIDLFPQFAQKLCREKGLTVVFPESLDRVADQSINVIVAADVLEHVDALDVCLRTFLAKLAPGGRIIVSGPTENLAYRIGRIIAGFGAKGDYHHTNIDRIDRQLCLCGTQRQNTRKLPFTFLPGLFKVIEFSKE